jgi:uncharacterized membrane protein
MSRRRATISDRSSERALRVTGAGRIVSAMDDTGTRIEALRARMATLERRTADELAAMRSELAELQGVGPAPRPEPMPVPRPDRRPEQSSLDLSWLTGARGLAVAGGSVTLLGIVFVFALAASRGWIGPSARCMVGGLVSASLLAAAVWARDLYGRVVAGLAAAGTGIGGLYVTLYAASHGYHLVGSGVVWAGVVVIASVAVAFALAWDSELLAALGLVAVVVAPPTIDGDLNGVGLGASAVAAAVALGIGQHRRWRVLGGLASSALLVQVAAYLIGAPHRDTAAVITGAAFALALAGAVAYRRRVDRLDVISSGLAAVSVPLVLLAVWVLLKSDTAEGKALLAAGAAYAAVAGGAWALGRLRDLAELLGANALLMAALATATFFSNGGLVVAWTLEGLVLTVVAARLDRRVYQAAGLAYFAIAAAHLYLFDTPVDQLFSEGSSPASGVWSILFLATAVGLAALALRGRPQLVPRMDLAGAVVAGLLCLYAASLGLMEAAQRIGGGDLHAQFQRGQMLVSALWALVALVVLAIGLTREIPELRWGGFGLLGLSLAKLFVFDLANLSSLARAGSFLAVGLTLLAGGFLVQRLAREAPSARRRAEHDPSPAAH